MSSFIMSDEFPRFCRIVQSFGNTVIPSDRVEAFNQPEQLHADMQALSINEKIFLLNECKSLKNKLSEYSDRLIFTETVIKGNYPENVRLNALFISNMLFCKASSLDNSVREYCSNNDIKIINVNQGYSRCSTAIAGKNAAITADTAIFNALKKEGIEVLKIRSGFIALNGYEYGFIGGASINLDENTLGIFGDISLHPDCQIINQFCNSHNVNLVSLCKGIIPIDIGGAVKIL